MQLKPLVMFSSFLLLLTLVACISVYAYNAYCVDPPKVKNGELTISSSMNTTGLADGYWSVYAKVGSFVDRKKGTYRVQQFSMYAGAWGSASQGGKGSAYVDGDDIHGNFHSQYDSVSYP